MPYAATTTTGTASAVTAASAPTRRARHQPTTISTANTASPYVDHTDTALSSQPGAWWAESTTSM